MRDSVEDGYFPRLPPSLARTSRKKYFMEDEKKEIINEEEQAEEPTPTPEENTEEEDSTGEEEQKEETPEEPEESDGYEEQLEKVQKRERSELDKAKRALHFNAERLKELGGDPADVLGVKPQKNNDVESLLDKKFAERDARQMVKSESEFKLVMWYVENKGLSVEEAHLLANKDRFKRSIDEVKRANVVYSQAEGGKKVTKPKVPERTPEEVRLLASRGLNYNPKTQTYQGKYTEEYYNPETKNWESRKLPRR